MMITAALNLLSAILPVLLLCCGCAVDDVSGGGGSPDHSVTLIMPVGGCGDNGYNDLILSGAMDFYHSKETEVRFSLRYPVDEAQVKSMIEEWMVSAGEENGEKCHSLLLLASGDYKKYVGNVERALDDNRRILVFECSDDGVADGVSTFRIGRYGAAYLVGLMARESPEAHVVYAFHGDSSCIEAGKGFCDGYKSSESGKKVICHYIASDAEGYSMPEKAYDVVKSLDNVFIFPLSGGSNNGIFRYSRENMFTLQLIAGMDVDCSAYSTRVPFSLVVHVDEIVSSLIMQWYSLGSLPRHTDYYMSNSDMIDVIINPDFVDRANILLDYYIDPEYWQLQKDMNFEKAVIAEKAYYGF